MYSWYIPDIYLCFRFRSSKSMFIHFNACTIHVSGAHWCINAATEGGGLFFCCMMCHIISKPAGAYLYVLLSAFQYLVCTCMYRSLYQNVSVCILYVLKNKILYLYVLLPKILYWPNQYIQILTHTERYMQYRQIHTIQRYSTDTYRYMQYRQIQKDTACSLIQAR
jgi:hypothetical protein